MLEAITGHLAEKAPVIIMIPFLVVIVLLVHELGHYIAARISGVRVERVVIGFGRTLYTRRDKNGTDWFIHLWPFKAYVGIADFDAIKGNIWRRLFVVLAGPFANLVLPFILMGAFFLWAGKPVAPAIVTGVEQGKPAYQAGIRPGDRIVSVAGAEIEYAAQILPYTRKKTDVPLDFVVEKNGQRRDLRVLPEWAIYRDKNGLEQAHGRIGLVTRQLPYNYEILDTVDGIDIENDDQARQLIYERLGQRAILGLKSIDRKTHDYVVELPRAANKNMMDKDHDDYKYFFIGRQRDNYYRDMAFGSAFGEAGRRNLELIRNVAKVPFQLFPIDKEWIVESYVVSDRTSVLLYYAYRFVFLLSLLSVLVGMINLIPFPGLDGSVLLIDTIEAVRRKNLTRRGKALWICGALILFYGCIITANAQDMEGYYGFLIEDITKAGE